MIPVPDASHVGEARRAVAGLSRVIGLDETAAGRVAIVVTELANNVAKHGRGGQLVVRSICRRTGIEVLALDNGPGIGDMDRAMRDGYSSGGTAGQGLGAIRRMSDLFDVYSQPGAGTVVVARMLNLKPEKPERMPEDKLDLGVVSIAIPGERVSGDAWTVIEGARGPSVVVVDGLGHGQAANEAAKAAIGICEQHQGEPPLKLLDAMHRGLRSTRGAAAAVAEIDENGQCVRFAGSGNVACSVASADGNKSLASMSGIVGHQIHKPQEFSTPFPPGASLVMYSDGITSRWRLDNYVGLRPRHPALAAGVVFRDCLRGRDDATIVVARGRRESAESES